MTASLPVLSSLTSRLAQARLLAQGWLSQLWTERPEAIERLLCQAYDLDPGGQSPGALLRQLARGGASGFETALTTTLPGLFEGAGALAAPPWLVEKPLELNELFPSLSAPADEPVVLGAERSVEDRFSGFTAGWSGNGSGGGDLLINRAWAENATVLDLAEMLLEQAGHTLQELLGLPEPRGEEGRIFAEGMLRLAAGLGGNGANPVVPEGTVEALRLRNDGGYLLGITALTGLAEGAGEQLIHLVDNQQPLQLRALPTPGPDSLGLQRFGVAETTEGAVMAGFGGGEGNFDDSGDLNWLLHRQQLLHLAALVDDFLGLLRELMSPAAAGSSAEGATPGIPIRSSVSIDLGAFQIASSQLRLDDPGLRAHIGAGRLLTFTLSPGTRLPRLAEGSPVPRGWNEGRPQELFLRPSSPGSNLFDVYAGVNVAGQPVGRLRLSADQETVVHAQQDINNLYQSGAFQLPAAERAEIDRIVAAIAAGNQTVRDVRISSSTDSEPLTAALRTKLLNLGYEGSNRGLAVARAEAMRSDLLERLDTLPGLDQPQLQLLLPPVPRLPVANAGERRYSDATYTLAWEQGTSPRDPAARFVRADLDLERRLAGGGTLNTSWTHSGSGASPGGDNPGGDNGLSLDLGDLLCRFTASYGVEDLRLLFGLLFPDSAQGNAADELFWEGASGEALAAGLLLWGYDNLLQAGGDAGMFSRILDRIPELEPLLREGMASREAAEALRSGTVPGISGELLAALSDPAVSLLPLWLAPEDGFRFSGIGNSIASAAALAAVPGALLDLVNLVERTDLDLDLDLCDLICAVDLLDGLPPLLADPAARATAAGLLAANEALYGWFADLDQATADRILRLDPGAWPILAAFPAADLDRWQQLADLSPRVWTAIRRFDFDAYGRQVLEAIRDGNSTALAGLTSWDLSTLRCVLGGLVLLTDAVADQLEGGLLNSAALAPLLSETERERYAALLSDPLRDLQAGLLELGPVLPQQLVARLQTLVDSTINTPLGLTGERRVEVRGSLPNLTALPAAGSTYWLELDFSGMRTSVTLPLPIEQLLQSALGIAPPDLPSLSANLSAELQGVLRFGIDLASPLGDHALLLDTNGPLAGAPALGAASFGSGSAIDWATLLPQLDGFDGERAELLAGFSASIALAPLGGAAGLAGRHRSGPAGAPGWRRLPGSLQQRR